MSELHFRLAELGIFAGQAHGAGHGDLASAAESEAIDAGNHRLAQIFDQVEHGPGRGACISLPLTASCLRQFIDVSAGDEGFFACAGENDDANLACRL